MFLTDGEKDRKMFLLAQLNKIRLDLEFMGAHQRGLRSDPDPDWVRIDIAGMHEELLKSQQEHVEARLRDMGLDLRKPL